MPTQVITSEANEKLKLFRSLLTSKGIKENHKFILSGRKLIDEFLDQKLMRFKISAAVYHTDSWNPKLEKNTELQRFVIPKTIFKEIDIIGTDEPILIIDFKPFDSKDFNREPQELELICPLGDPKNLGALVRSAVGFGVREIILTKESANPFLPQALKASAGAALFAHFVKSDLALNEIPVQAHNFALDLEGTILSKIQWPRNLRLWIGEEGPGLKLNSEQKKRMILITIPTQRIESLNAMVSASLALWEWKKSSAN